MKNQLKIRLTLTALLITGLCSVGKSQNYSYVGEDSVWVWHSPEVNPFGGERYVKVQYYGNESRIKKDAHALCQYLAKVKKADGFDWSTHPWTKLTIAYFPANDGIVHTNGRRIYRIFFPAGFHPGCVHRV